MKLVSTLTDSLSKLSLRELTLMCKLLVETDEADVIS